MFYNSVFMYVCICYRETLVSFVFQLNLIWVVANAKLHVISGRGPNNEGNNKFGPKKSVLRDIHPPQPRFLWIYYFPFFHDFIGN